MLNDIAKLINLVEKEYFSFRFVNAELQSVWIDLAKTIQSQFKSILIEDNEIVVYFNVKYYIADPCKLNHELTRLAIKSKTKKLLLIILHSTYFVKTRQKILVLFATQKRYSS